MASIREKELELVRANLLTANQRLNQMLAQSPDDIDNMKLYALRALIEDLRKREVELQGRRVRFTKLVPRY